MFWFVVNISEVLETKKNKKGTVYVKKKFPPDHRKSAPPFLENIYTFCVYVPALVIFKDIFHES